MGNESSNVLEEILPKWVLQKEEVAGEDVCPQEAESAQHHKVFLGGPQWVSSKCYCLEEPEKFFDVASTPGLRAGIEGLRSGKLGKGPLGRRSRKNQKGVIGCEEPITRLSTLGLTAWI